MPLTATCKLAALATVPPLLQHTNVSRHSRLRTPPPCPALTAGCCSLLPAVWCVLNACMLACWSRLSVQFSTRQSSGFGLGPRLRAAGRGHRSSLLAPGRPGRLPPGAATVRELRAFLLCFCPMPSSVVPCVVRSFLLYYQGTCNVLRRKVRQVREGREGDKGQAETQKREASEGQRVTGNR